MDMGSNRVHSSLLITFKGLNPILNLFWVQPDTIDPVFQPIELDNKVNPHGPA